MIEIDIIKEKIRLARIEISKRMDIKTAKEHNHIITFKDNGEFIPPVKEAQTYSIGNKKYAKIWLLNAQNVNGNGWGVSPVTLDANIKKFKGRPYVVTAQSFLGKPSMYGDEMVHPSLPTNDINKYLQHQEQFRVGTIVDVIKEGSEYFAQIELLKKYENHSLPPFCSPSIYQANFNEPENDIRTWEAMHLAGLNKDPAYGARLAILKGTCTGTKESCAIQFKRGQLEAELLCSQKQRFIKSAKLNELMEYNQVKNKLIKIASEFEENKHPRDNDVKFTNDGNKNNIKTHIIERFKNKIQTVEKLAGIGINARIKANMENGRSEEEARKLVITNTMLHEDLRPRIYSVLKEFNLTDDSDEYEELLKIEKEIKNKYKKTHEELTQKK